MPECQPSVPHTLPSSENPSSSPTLHRRRNSVVAATPSPPLLRRRRFLACLARFFIGLVSPCQRRPFLAGLSSRRRRSGSSPSLQVFDAVPVFDDVLSHSPQT
ncbi:hypothetical protein PIB30_070388, partial [Stylosanthes scabra]|nr:hypothetical protein [Stylosanthes scabra]